MVLKNGPNFCCFRVVWDYEWNHTSLVVFLIIGGRIRPMFRYFGMDIVNHSDSLLTL